MVLAPVGPPLIDNTHSMFTRGKRGMSKPVDRLNLLVDVLIPLPKSYRGALKDPHWHNAMMDEFSALQNNQTWDLVPRPPGANIVTGKWIFRHKLKRMAHWIVIKSVGSSVASLSVQVLIMEKLSARLSNRPPSTLNFLLL